MAKTNCTPIITPEAIAKFELLVVRGPDCWKWTGTKCRNGYGRFSLNRVLYLAHEIGAFIAHGPRPIGAFVCHRCDNPECANPHHLFYGTPQANVADMVAKGRQARGEQCSGAKLKEVDVLAILRDGRPSTHIAPDYGVSHASISGIKNGTKWKHITTPRAEHGNAKLSVHDVATIRASSYTSAQLAARYGVSHVTIRDVRSGKTWSHAGPVVLPEREAR